MSHNPTTSGGYSLRMFSEHGFLALASRSCATRLTYGIVSNPYSSFDLCHGEFRWGGLNSHPELLSTGCACHRNLVLAVPILLIRRFLLLVRLLIFFKKLRINRSPAPLPLLYLAIAPLLPHIPDHPDQEVGKEDAERDQNQNIDDRFHFCLSCFGSRPGQIAIRIRFFPALMHLPPLRPSKEPPPIAFFSEYHLQFSQPYFSQRFIPTPPAFFSTGPV